MEVTNTTLWLCLTATTLACVSAYTLRRRDRGKLSLKPQPGSTVTDCSGEVARRCTVAESAGPTTPESGLVHVLLPAVHMAVAAAPFPSSTCALSTGISSDISSATVLFSNPVHSGHLTESPIPSACGSAAGSSAGSSIASSDIHFGSDCESEDSRSCSCASSRCCKVAPSQCRSQHRPASQPAASEAPSPATELSASAPLLEQPRRSLRPAIRLASIPQPSTQAQSTTPDTAAALTGGWSGHPTPQGRRQGGRLKSPKSVTFKAGAAVICSPPTQQTIHLLAAGTPTVSTPASTRSSCCSASPSSLSSSSPFLIPAETAISSPPPHVKTVCEVAAAAAIAVGCSSGTQCGPSNDMTAAAQPRFRKATAPAMHAAAAAAAEEAMHAAALARAASGRQRVLAALNEARNRHARLRPQWQPSHSSASLSSSSSSPAAAAAALQPPRAAVAVAAVGVPAVAANSTCGVAARAGGARRDQAESSGMSGGEAFALQHLKTPSCSSAVCGPHGVLPLAVEDLSILKVGYVPAQSTPEPEGHSVPEGCGWRPVAPCSSSVSARSSLSAASPGLEVPTTSLGPGAASGASTSSALLQWGSSRTAPGAVSAEAAAAAAAARDCGGCADLSWQGLEGLQTVAEGRPVAAATAVVRARPALVLQQLVASADHRMRLAEVLAKQALQG